MRERYVRFAGVANRAARSYKPLFFNVSFILLYHIFVSSSTVMISEAPSSFSGFTICKTSPATFSISEAPPSTSPLQSAAQIFPSLLTFTLLHIIIFGIPNTSLFFALLPVESGQIPSCGGRKASRTGTGNGEELCVIFA